MPRFQFSKLVRDNIIKHQVASGAKPVYHRLSLEEHKQALVEKIIEEAREITQAEPGDVAGEIADVQQALDDLREKYNITANDIAQAQEAKNKKNGAFKKGIYVDSIELDENDKWTKYYRQNADRYPEI